jgi:hypothetical protein
MAKGKFTISMSLDPEKGKLTLPENAQWKAYFEENGFYHDTIKPKAIPEPEFENAEYVYVVKAGGLIKIGITKNVDKRIKQLQTANPNKLVLCYIRESLPGMARSDEAYLHKYFEKIRSNGEWFLIGPDMDGIFQSQNFELVNLISETKEERVSAYLEAKAMIDKHKAEKEAQLIYFNYMYDSLNITWTNGDVRAVLLRYMNKNGKEAFDELIAKIANYLDGSEHNGKRNLYVFHVKTFADGGDVPIRSYNVRTMFGMIWRVLHKQYAKELSNELNKLDEDTLEDMAANVLENFNVHEDDADDLYEIVNQYIEY